MFYSEYVLAKRGPLGKVWLAAHWTKKLSRKEISEANVVEACQNIQQPQVQLALRTSGHLLLGVVKIHDSKQNTLMHDCSEAFGRIKMVFRHDTVATNTVAAYAAITMQEVVPELDFEFFDDDAPFFEDSMTYDFTARRQDDLVLEDNFHASQRPGAADLVDEFETVEQGRFEDVEVGRRDELDTTADQNTSLMNSTFDKGQQLPDVPEADFGPADPMDAYLNEGQNVDNSLNLVGQDQTIVEEPNVSLLELPKLQPPKQKSKPERKRAKAIKDAHIEISTSDMRMILMDSDDLTKVPQKENFWLEPMFTRGERAKKRRGGPELSIDLAMTPKSLMICQNPELAEAMRKKFCFARRPGRVEDHIVVDEPERNVVNESLFDQPEIDFGPVQAFDEAGHPALDNTLDQTLEPAHEKTFDFEEETEQNSEETATGGFSKNTREVISKFKQAFEDKDELSYQELSRGGNRRNAAVLLLETLVLKTKGMINISQPSPFGDISIKATVLLAEQ